MCTVSYAFKDVSTLPLSYNTAEISGDISKLTFSSHRSQRQSVLAVTETVFSRKKKSADAETGK